VQLSHECGHVHVSHLGIQNDRLGSQRFGEPQRAIALAGFPDDGNLFLPDQAFT